MTREDLFLAIGQVEESRLARTEWNVQTPSPAMEDSDMKKRRSSKRIFRNLLVAAVIVSMLAVTAYAVAAFVIFESPEEMVMAVFGDKTGFDHKGVTTWEDPGKPGSVYDSPAYDRVPVDETVMEEDIAPYVSAVGQSITWYDYTLTVDSVLYEAETRSGLLTYIIENPKGIAHYEVENNGEVWFPGGELVTENEYWKNYIIQEKTTDTALAVASYFKLVNWDDDILEVSFYDHVARYSENLPEFSEILKQMKQSVTREDAVAKLRALIGEETFAEISTWASDEEIVDTAYVELANLEYGKLGECPYQLNIDCEKEASLGHVKLGGGVAAVTPMCFMVDVETLDYLHTDPGYISSDAVRSVVIRYGDGTEYVIRDDENKLDNTMYALSQYPRDNVQTEEFFGDGIEVVNSKNRTVLTLMFNRIIDVDAVTSVLINGVELPVD